MRERTIGSRGGLPVHCLRKALVAAACVCATLLSGAAVAQDAGLVVRDAWSRATPGGAKVGAGYLIVENRGSVAQQLVGGEAEVSAKLELHETSESGGVARMRQIDRITVEPGGSFAFAPSGHHLMLVDLKRPLKQGERFRATLVFEPGGRIPVQFEVRSIGAGSSPQHRH